MHEIEFKGTHYEIGNSYGSLAYAKGFRVKRLSHIDLDKKFIDESETVVRNVFPEILEEIRGFADGCKGTYEQLTSFLLGIGVNNDAPKCSCFAVKSKTTTFLARNHDYIKAFKKHTDSSLIVPRGGYAFLGQSDVFIGREDGINEKGLGIGMTFVGGGVIKPGINFILAGRYVLEKCDSVNDAVKVLSNMQLSTSQNFVLADHSGDIAVVEASPGKVAVRYPEPNSSYIIATNNFRDQDMLSFEKTGDRNWYQSLTRYDSIFAALEACPRTVDIAYCKEILSGEHGFVCQYKRWGRFDTLWSIVADLSTVVIERTAGNPSRTKYKEDMRLSSLARRREKRETGQAL